MVAPKGAVFLGDDDSLISVLPVLAGRVKAIQVQILDVIKVVVEPDVSLAIGICVIKDNIELPCPFLHQLSVTPKLGQHYPPPEETGRTAVPEEKQAQFKYRSNHQLAFSKMPSSFLEAKLTMDKKRLH